VHGVLLIIHDFSAPFQLAGVGESLTEAGGGAEVDGQDGIAAVGEPLVQGGCNPEIARPRAAVWDQHHGHRVVGETVAIAVVSRWERIVRHQLEAVTDFMTAECIGTSGCPSRAGRLVNRKWAPRDWRS